MSTGRESTIWSRRAPEGRALVGHADFLQHRRRCRGERWPGRSRFGSAGAVFLGRVGVCRRSLTKIRRMYAIARMVQVVWPYASELDTLLLVFRDVIRVFSIERTDTDVQRATSVEDEGEPGLGQRRQTGVKTHLYMPDIPTPHPSSIRHCREQIPFKTSKQRGSWLASCPVYCREDLFLHDK